MIYLAGPKLLFFKTKKTAGTSVEVALSCNASARDIVTPILPEDEAKRHELGGQFPVNWAWHRSSEIHYRERFDKYLAEGTIPRRWFGLKRGRLYRRSEAKYINHIPPDKVIGMGQVEMVRGAFVVTMCRHPYETVVSWASHLHADGGGDFDRILDRAARHRPLNEVYLFGARRPDFIIRYEHLHEDLTALEQRFGLTLLEKLPVTKGKARKDRRDAREVLSDTQKARIRESHARTFAELDYAP